MTELPISPSSCLASTSCKASSRTPARRCRASASGSPRRSTPKSWKSASASCARCSTGWSKRPPAGHHHPGPGGAAHDAVHPQDHERAAGRAAKHAQAARDAEHWGLPAEMLNAATQAATQAASQMAAAAMPMGKAAASAAASAATGARPRSPSRPPLRRRARSRQAQAVSPDAAPPPALPQRPTPPWTPRCGGRRSPSSLRNWPRPR